MKNLPKRLEIFFAETSLPKRLCRNVLLPNGVCTLALTVAKTSSHYDRFAISVPPVRPRLARWERKRPKIRGALEEMGAYQTAKKIVVRKRWVFSKMSLHIRQIQRNNLPKK